MIPVQAAELGFHAARPGFFFDGMELLAAASTEVGGFDQLEIPVALLRDEQELVASSLDETCKLLAGAYNAPFQPPATVDAYRLMLSQRVFDIVNRWSYIADIRIVERLQASFYFGFGIARTRTIALGRRLYELLVERFGPLDTIAHAPQRFRRLAAETEQQLATAASHEDFIRFTVPLHELATDLRSCATRNDHSSMRSSQAAQELEKQVQELWSQASAELPHH